MRMLRRGEATAPPKKITGAPPQPPKAKAEKSLKESRRAHLRKLRLQCAPAEGFQDDAKASQSTIADRGLGAAPPVMRSGERVASRARNSPFPKKAPQGHFFPFTGPAKRPSALPCPSRRVRVFAPGAAGLRVAPLHPRRGSSPQAAGGPPSPPTGCPCPYPGRGGERWGRKRPDCSPFGQQSAASAAPLSLR